MCDWDDDGSFWYSPSTPDCSGVGCCQANIMEDHSGGGYELKAHWMNGEPGAHSDATVWIVDSEFSIHPAFQD